MRGLNQIAVHSATPTFKVRLNGRTSATYRLTAEEIEKAQRRGSVIEIIPQGARA